MKMLGDRVLIEADKAKEKIGSFLVVEDWKSLPQTGTVLSVGPLVKEVEVGDRVLFERYAAVICEGEQRLVKERHIHAKGLE